MWLSCLGASLASPHSSPALLPASLSLLTSTRTWAWHRGYESSFCCLWSILPVSRCVGAGWGSSGQMGLGCPRTPFLAKTVSKGLSLRTAVRTATLSPSEGSRCSCLSTTQNSRSLTVVNSKSNPVWCWPGCWSPGGKVGVGRAILNGVRGSRNLEFFKGPQAKASLFIHSTSIY